MRNRLLGMPHRFIALLVAILALLLAAHGHAKVEASPEYAIKSAFLVKFAAFVEWPSNAFADVNAPFVIGVLGEDPFGPELERNAQGVTVKGRPIVIKRYQRVDQATDAHILYISPVTQERRDVILNRLRDEAILTVTDKSREPGAVVGFVIQENKVRFEIDAESAERAGLKVSSKLLALARPAERR